jgi:hypothetical protein
MQVQLKQLCLISLNWQLNQLVKLTSLLSIVQLIDFPEILFPKTNLKV